MNIDWQALRDGKIAVLCRSAEECEAFLCEAINQQINVNHSWVEDPTSAAANHWLRTESDPEDWHAVAYGFSQCRDLGFCWPAWWKNRGYSLVDFRDAQDFAISSIDDLV